MPLLIRNGDIVTVGSRVQADIYVENETISRISKNLEAPPNAQIIDAAGKLVFPGFIDPHVHIYLPFMATFAKDTHETASIAALIGGTTTYIEMCCPNRNDDALEGYQLWKSKADGKSACDYAFHMSVTKFVKETEPQLRQIVAKRLGVIVTAHCENAELVARLQQMLLAEGKTGPEWHEPSRPESVEAEGTGRFAAFLENTGATGYVVHLSCEKALHAALDAKSRGVRIYVESVLPHFLLDKSYAERPGIEGMKHVMSPPLRAKHNQIVLWNALALGSIDTVGTDHCPFDTEQKLLGKDSFINIPNGIPGIEDRVNLLYTHGLKRGRLELDRFVDAASTRAARLFGLFPQKGTIAVGSDADLVVYDSDYRGVVSAKSQHVNNDYSGFEGMEIEGRPSVVTVRGKIQVRDGKFIGERGRGKMLKRKPTHF
jgi:dihydropyrimidinase